MSTCIKAILDQKTNISPISAQIEAMIAQSLPKVVEALIERALDGDNVAAKYLCDRILGKPHHANAVTNQDVLPFTQTNKDVDRQDEPENKNNFVSPVIDGNANQPIKKSPSIRLSSLGKRACKNLSHKIHR